MGARFRLRANFDLSSYSPTNRIILQALKTYGMMLADNGSAWFISGAPDARWDDTETLSRAVWPEYNLHGPVLGSYWNGLFDDFPDYG